MFLFCHRIAIIIDARGFTPLAQPRIMLSIDQVLGKGRYRIISNFASDECGALYEAYDTVSNTTVVLRENISGSGKVLTAAQLDAFKNAFAGEAKALREVRHEAILSVNDYFSDIDRHYLVMEPVDGYDLTRFLDPNESAPALLDVLLWADQVLDALNYLHNLPKPLIHRDIRPANIRLTSNFKVKLLTAGIGTENTDVIMASAGNPADSSVLNYRPLEQLWGGLDPASQKVVSNSYSEESRRVLNQPLDARSDLYSFGATLYHVLTRTLPKDALERSIEILDGNPDPLLPPSEVESSVPAEVSDVLMKAMQLHREERFESASMMRQVLKTALASFKERKAAGLQQPRLVPEALAESSEARLEEPSLSVVANEAIASVKLEHESAASVEQRKMELEAEQRRLEKEKRRLEKERANLAAQQELKRAEQRRVEMEADLARQRREAERIKTAKSGVGEIHRSKAETATDEQFLLEVEPVPAASAASDSFEWSEEELNISKEPARKATADVRAFSADNEIDFRLGAAPRTNWKTLAAGGAAAVVISAVLGWVFLGGSSTQNENPEPAVSVPTAPQRFEAAPVSSVPASSTNTNALSVEPSTETNVDDMADRHSETPATQGKQKKPGTPPAKSPAKKKVTVDDLINDN